MLRKHSDLALSNSVSGKALVRIIHQPLGMSPRLLFSPCQPDASAFRLILRGALGKIAATHTNSTTYGDMH
jgi:hypothetical protein